MAGYSLLPLPDHAGDKRWRVQRADGRVIGMVRYNPRTGDWHATQDRRGRPAGRYYGTERGAATWCLRGATLAGS